MDEVIKALTIFRKYANPTYPFHAEDETLMVLVDPAIVSEEDKQLLEGLGFLAMPTGYRQLTSCFISFRYGSA